MGRPYRLRGRSGARRALLSGDPQILADAARRRADAELFGHAAQDRAAGDRITGFRDPGAARAWRRWADQSVRNRVAWADVIARHRRSRRRSCGRLNLRRYSSVWRDFARCYSGQSIVDPAMSAKMRSGAGVTTMLGNFASAVFRLRSASTARSGP